MGNSFRFGLGLATLLAVAGALLGWQHLATLRLRSELDAKRARAREVAGLQDANARLRAAELTPAEREHRREERDAWSALLGELEAMRRRTAAGATTKPSPAMPATPAAPQTPPSLKEGPVAAALWRNVGQATPEAAFETALWAAAAGDMEALAQALALDEPTRARVAASFDRLPAALRQDIGSPERMVALLTAKHVPLGSAQIITQFGSQAEESRLVAKVTEPDGISRELFLTLRVQDERWRLLVPPQALVKYLAFLQGKPAPPP